MKKCLAGLLVLMLLMGSAWAEGMTPVNAPITIDGVRVAFFDAEGNYLQTMEKNGLLWVPLNALCENLGKNAQVQGQSVMVDGVRVGMFDENGNFLMPEDVNGTTYVPLAAFCQSVGIEILLEGNAYAIRRAAAAPVAAAPAPTAEPEPEHPEYAVIKLDEKNFYKYFSIGITMSGFEEQKTKYVDEKLGYWFAVGAYFHLNATATTPYKYENVNFTAAANLNDTYASKDVTFSEVMPQSGELTKTATGTGGYFASYSHYNVKGNLLRGTKLKSASGKIYIPWEQAQSVLENSYQEAELKMSAADYAAAQRIFQDLAQNSYRDSKARAEEAGQKLAAQKAQKQKDDYAAAQTAFDNGDWDTAIKGFKALGDYEDSKAKLTVATENKNAAAYEKALALEKDGQYAEAIAAFEALKDYKDSAQHLAACRTAKADQENRAAYEGAEQLEAAGDYVGAYDAFIKIAYFEDSEQRAEKLAVYSAIAEAETKLQEGQPVEAKKALEPYKDHPNAQALYKSLALRGAEQLVTAFNSEGWAVAKEGKTNYYLLNIEGDTKDFNGAEYQYGGWQDGLMRLKNQEGYLYADLKGEAAFEKTFKTAEAFYQGKALVTGQDGAVCVIDTAGQTVAQMPEVSGRTYVTYMGENLVKFEEKDKYGLINLDGKVVVKAKYTKSISRFVDGLAVTCTQKGKKNAYSVINAKGKAVIKEGKYEIMNVLSENLIACYLRNDNWGKGKTYPGVINLKGKTIRKGEYNNKEFCRVGDYIMMRTESTSGSGASTGWTVFDKEGKYLMGYTSNIQPLVSGDGKRVYIENHKGGVKQLALLHEPNQWRRDLDGCQMDQASPYIALKKNDGWHVYDLDLNLIN